MRAQKDVLTVKFDSTAVANFIWSNIAYHIGIIPPHKPITLTVSGQLNDGEQFAGSGTIKVMYP